MTDNTTLWKVTTTLKKDMEINTKASTYTKQEGKKKDGEKKQCGGILYLHPAGDRTGDSLTTFLRQAAPFTHLQLCVGASSIHAFTPSYITTIDNFRQGCREVGLHTAWLLLQLFSRLPSPCSLDPISRSGRSLSFQNNGLYITFRCDCRASQ